MSCGFVNNLRLKSLNGHKRQMAARLLFNKNMAHSKTQLSLCTLHVFTHDDYSSDILSISKQSTHEHIKKKVSRLLTINFCSVSFEATDSVSLLVVVCTHRLTLLSRTITPCRMTLIVQNETTKNLYKRSVRGTSPRETFIYIVSPVYVASQVSCKRYHRHLRERLADRRFGETRLAGGERRTNS